MVDQTTATYRNPCAAGTPIRALRQQGVLGPAYGLLLLTLGGAKASSMAVSNGSWAPIHSPKAIAAVGN
jgi:hypothetical protein